MERGTGFEPATTSLEGWCSATELPPHVTTADSSRRVPMESAAGLFQNPDRSGVGTEILMHPARDPAMQGTGGFEFAPSTPEHLPLLHWLPVVRLGPDSHRDKNFEMLASLSEASAVPLRGRVEVGREGFEPPKA